MNYYEGMTSDPIKEKAKPMTGAERMKLWRANNKEKNRDKQTLYMRQYRAKRRPS